MLKCVQEGQCVEVSCSYVFTLTSLFFKVSCVFGRATINCVALHRSIQGSQFSSHDGEMNSSINHLRGWIELTFPIFDV